MLKARIILFSISTLLSVVISLCITYLYCGYFQHERYWNGTISRVFFTHADTLVNFIESKDFNLENSIQKNNFQNLIKPLNGKVGIVVKETDIEIFSNMVTKFETKSIYKTLYSDKYTIDIIQYNPPSWNSVFIRWINHPLDWFTFRYDFISYPFITFALIIQLSILTMAYRYKSLYLDKEVLNALEALKK